MTMWIFADTETTGVSPDDQIVELAYAITDDEFNAVDKHCTLIDPQMKIPSCASAVHGIANKHVEDAPTITEYMEVVKQMPLMHPDSVFVAYNAKFDYRYLKDYLDDDVKIMCAMKLARRIYPDADSYKLQALRYYLELPDIEGDAHRADFDVAMLIALVQRMMADSGMSLQELCDLSQAPVEVKSMSFGKHKGKKIADLPSDYVRWMIKDSDMLDKNEDLAYTVRKYHPSFFTL